MDAAFGFAEFLIGACLLLFFGTIGSVVTVSLLPRDNPLRQILHSLCYRLAATFAAGVVAIPVEILPGIDVLYDLGVPALLAYYWWTFLRDALRSDAPPPLPPTGRDLTKS